ncbi:AP-4 complex subunit epsilon [Rhizophagus clarus]|uniref:AP-2 complex subunit alpha n=2 Tax=Rhizophagus clarus TaxID=94130 RepID=A0A8H3MDM3_9GLOM|nr:AP-4 complex subunit epsilon [Rhizophagus clarus]
MSSQIPTIFNSTFLTSGLSKRFFEFITKVGEARSKQEEDRYVTEELTYLKNKLNQPDISTNKMKDYITRLVYCDMLGHNVEFGHIHAVKLVQSAKGLWEKRVGYLACSLFLHETHELSIMLINTIQKDLRSSNHLEVCAALTALCQLLNTEMIPAVFGLVEEKLSHPKDIVRKKAVMVFHRLSRDKPELMIHLDEKFRQMLSGGDPGVLGAILCLFIDFVKEDPSKYKDLVPALVNILEQVLDRYLPRNYDYHGAPAPWIQIKIIQILGMLAQDDEKISSEIGQLIVHTLKKAENGVDCSYAIIFECIRALAGLHSRVLTTLIHKPSHLNPLSIITRFLKSHNHNLKYLGLIALSEIDPVWWVEGEWWGEEQMRIIVDCLEEKDDSLKRKTLDLLYMMVNPQNIIIIVEKMTEVLRTTPTTDVFLRKLLVERIIEICGKFATNSEWMVKSIIIVFEIADNLFDEKTGNLAFLIVSRETDDPEKDSELRKYAVVESIKVLDKDSSNISSNLLIWTVKVLGEFLNHLDEQYEVVINKLCELLNKDNVDRSLQTAIITSLLKLVSKTKNCSNNVMEAIIKCRESSFGDVKQRSQEFIILADDFLLLDEILKPSSYIEEFAIDETLSFLDEFVETALKNGAKPYNPIPIVQNNETSESEKKSVEIRYEAYEKPDLSYFQSKPVSSNILPYIESRYGDSGLASPPIEDSMLTSWSGNPPVTPGQLAWMSVSKDSTFGEEESDGNRQNRQSLITSVAKIVTSPNSLKWSRAGYKPIQQQSSRDVVTSPTLSAISSEETKSPSSNVHPFLRTSSKTAPITSITAKNVVLSEKDRLASALLSGVGTNSETNVYTSKHSVNVNNQKPNQRKNIGTSSYHARTESTFSEIYHNLESLHISRNILQYLKPLQMTMVDYETIWTKLSNERREEVVGESIINNMEIIKQRLEGTIDKVNEFGSGGDLIGVGNGKGSWKVVEIIDKEAIAASQYNQMNSSTLSLIENVVLLHFKIEPSYCVFTIRSDIEGIIDNIAEEMRSYFVVE